MGRKSQRRVIFRLKRIEEDPLASVGFNLGGARLRLAAGKLYFLRAFLVAAVLAGLLFAAENLPAFALRAGVLAALLLLAGAAISFSRNGVSGACK